MGNNDLNRLEAKSLRNYILKDYHSFKNYMLNVINSKMLEGDDYIGESSYRFDDFKYKGMLFVLYNFVAGSRVYIPSVDIVFFRGVPIKIVFSWEGESYDLSLSVPFEIPLIVMYDFLIKDAVSEKPIQHVWISLKEKREFDIDFVNFLIEDLSVMRGVFHENNIENVDLWV